MSLDPFLKTSTPVLKAKAAPGGSLLARLKVLRSRDSVFLGAGLLVLGLAPAGEMLFGGGGADGIVPMEAGFAGRGNPFGDAGRPYEDGVGGGLAAGGLVGQDERVVTPLSAMDPTKLVAGPGEEAAPQLRLPQTSAPAQREPKPSANWRDAIATAAKASVSKAARTASLPKPPGRLTAALKGLATAGGGSGASLASPRLSPLSSKGITSLNQVASSLSRTRAARDYRGPADRSLAAGTGGGPGASRLLDGANGGAGGAGGDSGGFLTDGRSATAVPSGTGAGGGTLAAAAEKGPGVSSLKDARTQTEKETLAQMKAKMEMQKAVDLKWDKKKYEELDRKKMLEQVAAQTAAQTASQAVLKGLHYALGLPPEDENGRPIPNAEPRASPVSAPDDPRQAPLVGAIAEHDSAVAPVREEAGRVNTTVTGIPAGPYATVADAERDLGRLLELERSLDGLSETVAGAANGLRTRAGAIDVAFPIRLRGAQPTVSSQGVTQALARNASEADRIAAVREELAAARQRVNRQRDAL